MKKLITIMLFIPFFSCSVEAEQPINYDILGEWVLVQTEGQVLNSERTGSDMPFQETYLLKENGSFIKTRIVDGEEIKATGTFELSHTSEEMDDENVRTFIYFHHESENSLIANCYSHFTEHLYITSNRRLISSYNACDGFGLEYEKLD